MAEIVFWQERGSVLSDLSEQLKEPMVKKILEVMTKADAGILQTLDGTITELNKYRVESNDNLRFLSTLERHFLVIFFIDAFCFLFCTLAYSFHDENRNYQELVVPKNICQKYFIEILTKHVF